MLDESTWLFSFVASAFGGHLECEDKLVADDAIVNAIFHFQGTVMHLALVVYYLTHYVELSCR